MTCEQSLAQIHFYLDGELQASEAMQLEAHLVDCTSCRAEYESLLAVSGAVRSAHPLYKASDESLQKTKAMVHRHSRRALMFRMAIAASILLAGFFTFSMIRDGNSDGFETFAAEAHLMHARGALPLDVRSTEPQVVAGWLSSRLPFHLSIPNYPEQPGHTKPYSLVGARLAQFRDQEVAFLAYKMDDRPISLMVATSTQVTPAGGQVYRSGGLSFHMKSYKGLQLISWVDKGLSYALVSDLKHLGSESCAICHGGPADRQKFEPLRPKI